MIRAMRPDAAAWRAFFVQLLQGAGIGSLGAGAIFFVAANWQDYGLMGRFAILQVALAACAGLAFWRPPPSPVGQSTLVLAILVTGALLALFGQSYQTGADVFELFFTWAALAIPFALAGRSGAVWATWWTVLNVGMALFCGLEQLSFLRFAWMGRLGLDRSALMFLAALVNLAGAYAFMERGPLWLVRLLSIYGFAFGTVACIVAIVENRELLVVPAFAVACGAVAWDTLRRRSDVFPMALICAAWIAISTVFIGRHVHLRDLGAFFVLAIWLIGTSTGAGFLLMRWVRQWK
jgi:uncharacterized membrane protein